MPPARRSVVLPLARLPARLPKIPLPRSSPPWCLGLNTPSPHSVQSSDCPTATRTGSTFRRLRLRQRRKPCGLLIFGSRAAPSARRRICCARIGGLGGAFFLAFKKAHGFRRGEDGDTLKLAAGQKVLRVTTDNPISVRCTLCKQRRFMRGYSPRLYAPFTTHFVTSTSTSPTRTFPLTTTSVRLPLRLRFRLPYFETVSF